MRNSLAHPPEYLGHPYFALTLACAAILHMGMLLLWNILPKTEVVSIPVRALSVTLGDGDSTDVPTPPSPMNSREMEAAITKLMREVDAPAKADKPKIKAPVPTPKLTADEPKQSEKPDDARQYVRFSAPAAQGTEASEGSKTDNAAETLTRYEQTISLWIQKFKVYPEEARAQNMEGDTVVRIRIDRQGTIRYYILESSTGYPLLDRAAVDMIRRANPVPPVPADYPPGDMLEFLIPVSFHLQ